MARNLEKQHGPVRHGRDINQLIDLGNSMPMYQHAPNRGKMIGRIANLVKTAPTMSIICQVTGYVVVP